MHLSMRTSLPTAASLVLLVVLPLACAPDRGAPPWQIEQLEGGAIRVFGLVPGRSTLAEAPPRFGPAVEVALFEAPDGSLAVEGYYSKVSPGGLTGRLVLSLQLDDALLATLRDNSPERKTLRTGNVRLEIAAEDARRVRQAVIRGMTFVPTADLDEEIVRGRFGEPEQRLRIDENTALWLYPTRGLAVALNRQGKDFLQYVHPADFAWARQGLQTSGL